MAVFTAIVLTAFLFENDDLVALDLIDNFGFHAGARDSGGADFCGAGACDEQDFVQGDSVALFGVEQFDFKDIILLDSILLATGSNDCVHNYDRFISSVYHESRLGLQSPARDEAIYA